MQQLCGSAVHGIGILNAEFDEHILMAQENVLRYGQAVQGSQLLYDDGNAFLVGFDLVPGVDLFAIQDKCTAVNAVNACQHVGQCGLTRTVLSDQGVYFSFVNVEGDILDRLGDTKGLA